MAKDRKKLLHIHSSIPDKQPTAASLEVGEIAVNNAANQEFLSIRNSDDKVKRFSSDEQIITWIEKKEVMPYEGYTRGSNGPTGSTGPNSVTNDDLLQNKSNLIIKLNQVAAANTAKHNKVNGAKDIYGKCVNPTSDSGVTDGAGFAIDMSRYAMIGANPSFSSLTVTDKTDLSGNTTIANGDGTSTRTGHTLTIKTTDVSATDTNWTETITNRTSTVTNETDKITTLNESATTRTTVVGTENLHVSGTTTEVHDKAVTITNNTGVTETTKGNVVENVSGTTTINHSGTTTTNESGDTIINTTGNTTINSTGSTTIQSTGAGSDITIYAKDMICETSDNIAAFKGANITNVGSDCGNANQTKTLNVRANTADTRVTSAYTSATTATTIIGTSNASATTATLSGNTLTINEATSISAKTPSTTISGTNFTLNESNTVISSCTTIDLVTDDLNITQCSEDGGTADFEFCNGFNVKSNAVNFEQCSTAGTFTIKEKATNISGETLTIRESGATNFSGGTLTTTTSGNTTMNVSGNTAINTSGTTTIKTEDGTTIQTTAGNTNINTSGNTNITSTGTTTLSSNGITTIEATGANSDVCISATDSARIYGKGSTYVGVKCDGTAGSATTVEGTTLNLSGSTVNVDATDYDLDATNVCVSGATKANFYGKQTNIGIECGGTIATATTIEGTTVGISGNTTNVSGATTLNMSGKTVNVDATDIDVDASNNYCLSAATKANIYGKTTNIGIECGGTTATTINVSGTTINEGGTTNNNNFTTINNTATTINNKANFNITGATYISGNTVVSGDVTIGDDLTIPIPCNSITSTTVNNALCEIFDRGVVTIEKNTSPTDPQLATVYTVKQNGAVINTIEVAKDQFLQNAEVVKNTSGEWVIRLTWWIYDPDSGTHTTATTDVNASELVKDLTAVNPGDNGTAANHNVKVSSWYDSTSGDMKFSAETTPTMHVTNLYATTNVSGATVSGTSTSAGTLTVTGNTTLRGTLNVSGASTINGVLTIPSGISKKLTWSGGTFTADTTTGYNGSADKVITVPTAISHLPSRGKLTITHNGLSDTYDPASDKLMTLPHSALTINFGVATGQTNTSYNTSAGKTITIPTATSHLSRAALTIDYNADVRSKSDTSYDTTAAATVSIPGSLDHLSNYDGTNININHPTKINGNVSVTGTITASGAIYSSDRNLKENIFDISENEFERIGFVKYKTYNFKGEDNKMYGVIAQDLQDAGLGEMVYSRDDGTLAVDYTSLMILQLARLKRDNENMLNHIVWLERRIEKLEGGNKE